MVSKALEKLTEAEFAYLEKLLGKELAEAHNRNKIDNNSHSKSQTTRILNCYNAVKQQRSIARIHAVKW